MPGEPGSGQPARPGVAEGLPSASQDSSVWSLVLVNAIALTVALAGGWNLIDLMAVYWVQSVIIGVSYFFRMLNLERFSTENPGGSPWGTGLLICAVAFAVSHYFSYRYHRQVDAQGTPNIGTLMFTPYLRVVPMHLTIVFGAVAFGSACVRRNEDGGGCGHARGRTSAAGPAHQERLTM